MDSRVKFWAENDFHLYFIYFKLTVLKSHLKKKKKDSNT